MANFSRNVFFYSAILVSILNSNILSADSNYSKDPLEMDKFSFPNPSSADLGKPLNLWATYYYTSEMKAGTGDIPLRSMNGDVLGPTFSRKNWCSIALEGSVRVKSEGDEIQTFNFAGTSSNNPVNCRDFFKFDVSKTKFKLASGPWGDGLPDRYILSPYRTIATDASYIEPGTVIFIPKARGTKIKLPNGKEIIHDGYFFAGDKGGAIRGAHIDVFIGVDEDAPYFPWIKSSSSGTFTAYLVKNPEIINEITDQHRPN